MGKLSLKIYTVLTGNLVASINRLLFISIVILRIISGSHGVDVCAVREDTKGCGVGGRNAMNRFTVTKKHLSQTEYRAIDTHCTIYKKIKNSGFMFWQTELQKIKNMKFVQPKKADK